MPRLLVDLTPLRRHRAFRRLWLGQLVSLVGTQLTVVGVSYQAYTLTHSTLLVGLVSTAQLPPLLIGSIAGGAIADARDRRSVLVVTTVALAGASSLLVVNAVLSHPHVWPLFVVTAATAALAGADFAARRAMVPMIVPRSDLPEAIAVQTILQQFSLVAGPALAGVVIAAGGVPLTFGLDVGSYALALPTVLLLPRLVPVSAGGRAGFAAIVEGVSFLKGQRFVASTFWIDLNAMIFGMPRAVFPALGLGFFHGDASTVGLLFAAPGFGALAGSLATGWVGRVTHRGRAIAVCVALWGGCIAVFGFVPNLGVGLVLLALAGAADAISAVFRSTVLQTNVPESLQGRLSGLYFAVVAGGPRLGDAETGGVAALAGPQVAVWSGGVACVAGALLLLILIPDMWRDSGGGRLSPRQFAEAEEAAAAGTAAELGETGMVEGPG